MHSLEDILNNNVSAQQANPEPQAEVIEQPEPPETEAEEQPQEAAEDVTGEDQKADEPDDQVAPPAAGQEETLEKKISAFQRKAEDETRKRQDYEKQLAEVRKQAEEQAEYIKRVQDWFAQNQQPQGQEPEVDLYDPRQAQQFVDSQLQPKLYETRVLLSQELLRSAHPDYDEMEEIFAEQCKVDPSLEQRLLSHPVPAKFAYEEGKKIKLMKELSDPDAYRAKLREEIMAELQAQQPPAPQPAQTQTRPVPQPPKSLAGVSSAARNPVKHPWAGPTPLHEIIGS